MSKMIISENSLCNLPKAWVSEACDYRFDNTPPNMLPFIGIPI